MFACANVYVCMCVRACVRMCVLFSDGVFLNRKWWLCPIFRLKCIIYEVQQNYPFFRKDRRYTLTNSGRRWWIPVMNISQITSHNDDQRLNIQVFPSSFAIGTIPWTPFFDYLYYRMDGIGTLSIHYTISCEFYLHADITNYSLNILLLHFIFST